MSGLGAFELGASVIDTHILFCKGELYFSFILLNYGIGQRLLLPAHYSPQTLMIAVKKSQSIDIHSQNQHNAANANAVAMIVLLLAAKAEKPEEAAFTRRPSISVDGADVVDGPDEVDSRATRFIFRMVDRLIGVFSGRDEAPRCDVARQLKSLVGKEEAAQLISSFPEDYQDELETQKELLLMEVRQVDATRLHIDGLRDKDLRSIPDDSAAPDYASPLEDAVEWILDNSNSKQDNNTEDFLRVIGNYAYGTQNLMERDAIDALHAQLVPKMRMDSRHDIPGAPTPATVSGEILFNLHLQKLRTKPVDPDDLAEHMFAGIVGYHPYPDGNGRVGRAVYAILKLRARAFQRLSVLHEDALTGRSINNVPVKEFAAAAQVQRH